MPLADRIELDVGLSNKCLSKSPFKKKKTEISQAKKKKNFFCSFLTISFASSFFGANSIYFFFTGALAKPSNLFLDNLPNI